MAAVEQLIRSRQVDLHELLECCKAASCSAEELAFQCIDSLGGMAISTTPWRLVLRSPHERLEIPELLVFAHTLCRYRYNVWLSVDARNWSQHTTVDKFDILNAINGMPFSHAFLIFDAITPFVESIWKQWLYHDFFLPTIVPFNAVLDAQSAIASLQAWSVVMSTETVLDATQQQRLLAEMMKQFHEPLEVLELSPAAYRSYRNQPQKILF